MTVIEGCGQQSNLIYLKSLTNTSIWVMIMKKYIYLYERKKEEKLDIKQLNYMYVLFCFFLI